MTDKTFNKLRLFLVILICVLVTTMAVLWLYDDAMPSKSTDDAVIFLDVGQGDSALIKSGEFAALIDTSTATNGMNIAKKLRKEGVNDIDVLILTHPHDDHIGSAEFLLGEFPVSYIVLSDVLAQDDENARCYKDIKDYAANNGIDCRYATEGMVINIGNFELTVLMSDETAEDENDTSIVIMAENDGKKFLFMGDAEINAETKLLTQGVNLDCDVLKVGHHGSNTSTSARFLDVASPAFSVISCGKNNSYSHPHDIVLSRLIASKTAVLRTDVDGDIKFTFKDGKLVYTTD